jgi:DUF2946 family protein
MRPHLGWYFPIVVAALLLQLLAPLVAIRTAAAFANDPLQFGEICANHANAVDDQQAPPGNPQADHSCCAFCFAAGVGAATLDAPRTFVALQLEYQRIAWLSDATGQPTVHVVSSAQARAPPAFS